MRRAMFGVVTLAALALGCAKAEAVDTSGSAAYGNGGSFNPIGGNGGAAGGGGSSGGGGTEPMGGTSAGGTSAGGTSAGAAGAASGGTTSSGGTTAGGGTTASGGTGAGGGVGGTSGTGGTSASGGTGGVGGTGSGVKGDCCTETPKVPGCATSTVQSCVCAKDPFCCTLEWDVVCAGETLTMGCGKCPTPADCCAAGSCSSDAVTECVAAKNATCYSSWSAACAGLVVSSGCGTCGTTQPGSVWINEIHYDNSGTDSGEGVEIAGTAGTDVTGYKLVFYNGSPALLVMYMTKTLSGSIASQQNGFGTLWVAAAGIQNGGGDATPEPDGVALVDKAGKVVQFLSYEGAFTAKDGAAAGMQSTNIGKSETTTSPVGQSLGLGGTGKTYSAFTWAGPVTATPGQPNTGQTFN